MKIVSYEQPTTENEYKADVLALRDATIDNPAQAGVFEVPADKIGRAKRLIGEAAREDADRSASFAHQSEPNKNGIIELTVILKPRRKTPVFAKNTEEAAPVEDTAETPAE